MSNPNYSRFNVVYDKMHKFTASPTAYTLSQSVQTILACEEDIKFGAIKWQPKQHTKFAQGSNDVVNYEMRWLVYNPEYSLLSSNEPYLALDVNTYYKDF